MSSNTYTYFGPILKIKDDAKIITKISVCKNENCSNHNFKNGDKFCSNCGTRIEEINVEKNIGNISSVYELCERMPGMEEFEDYIEYPEGNKNTLILTMDNIGKHGFYMYADNFNFKIIEEDFNIKEKINDFLEEINKNNFKKILDVYLKESDYKIAYGLLNFGDC
jgi:hypothetical protein